MPHIATLTKKRTNLQQKIGVCKFLLDITMEKTDFIRITDGFVRMLGDNISYKNTAISYISDLKNLQVLNKKYIFALDFENDKYTFGHINCQ